MEADDILHLRPSEMVDFVDTENFEGCVSTPIDFKVFDRECLKNTFLYALSYWITTALG